MAGAAPGGRRHARSGPAVAGCGTSGRRFVILAVIAVLVIWGSLYLVFRERPVRDRERAAYGASQVCAVIDAFAEVKPPVVDPARWRDAVARTHDLLVAVTASNLLGIEEMRDLRRTRPRRRPRAGPTGHGDRRAGRRLG